MKCHTLESVHEHNQLVVGHTTARNHIYIRTLVLIQREPRLRRHINHNGHTAGEERGV